MTGNVSKVYVVIPAYNEEESVGKVINDIPYFVEEIVVVDNNSNDSTFEVVQQHGATALKEPQQGYGKACLTGIEYLKSKIKNEDIVVFLDADYSDFPSEMSLHIDNIKNDNYELVIGSRALGNREKGAMTTPQIFGNWLATFLIKLFYRVEYTDLGPFRAVTWEALEKIQMKDEDYGWTVEMQVKAAKLKIRSTEVVVNYRKRIGVSKVSGTIKGVILAGYKILWTIFKNLW